MAPTGANHEPLPPCRAAFRRLRELKIENGKCRMMEVAPCATPQFYTLHFTFYISHAAAPFRPSAVGKSHRHEPGVARHEHLCLSINFSAIFQEMERSLLAACDQSLIMRIALEHQSRIYASARHHQNHILHFRSHTTPLLLKFPLACGDDV